MLLIVNKLCNLIILFTPPFISVIKIKYTDKLQLPLSSLLPNSVKYSAKNANKETVSSLQMNVLTSKNDFLYPQNSYFLLLR